MVAQRTGWEIDVSKVKQAAGAWLRCGNLLQAGTVHKCDLESDTSIAPCI
jgi:hypothetical protein